MKSIFADDETRINPESLAQGFTQSEITLMDSCAEKWYRAYNQLLRLKGKLEWPFVYGTAVHDTLETFYARQDGEYDLATLQVPDDIIPDSEFDEMQAYWSEVLRVQMERYAAYYANDFEEFTIEATERVVHFTHEGVPFSGKIDNVWRKIGTDFWGPNDHKTSGMFSPEVLAGWNFRFQFLFYSWLWWKATGEKPTALWWNGIRKPQLRRKDTIKDGRESFESFIERIRVDMIQVPEKYFKRQMWPLEEGQLEHFEKRILGPKLSRLKLLTDVESSGIIVESLARNMQTNNCTRYNKPCEFMGLCKHGWEKEGMFYVRRETKHEELEEE